MTCLGRRKRIQKRGRSRSENGAVKVRVKWSRRARDSNAQKPNGILHAASFSAFEIGMEGHRNDNAKIWCGTL